MFSDNWLSQVMEVKATVSFSFPPEAALNRKQSALVGFFCHIPGQTFAQMQTGGIEQCGKHSFATTSVLL